MNAFTSQQDKRRLNYSFFYFTVETWIKFSLGFADTSELTYMHVNLVVPCPLINCVPSLFYIDTKGCFVGWGILFLHHMLGSYSGKAVVFKFLGLVSICQ